jgi:hypothetical protein
MRTEALVEGPITAESPLKRRPTNSATPPSSPISITVLDTRMSFEEMNSSASSLEAAIATRVSVDWHPPPDEPVVAAAVVGLFVVVGAPVVLAGAVVVATPVVGTPVVGVPAPGGAVVVRFVACVQSVYPRFFPCRAGACVAWFMLNIEFQRLISHSSSPSGKKLASKPARRYSASTERFRALFLKRKKSVQ